nr:hypothetical protein [Streptomyces sp. SID14478]
MVIVALIFIAALVLGAYATVKAVGAAKRGVDRTVAQARRTVEDTTLRARSFAPQGTASELAQLRLKLRTSMRATQDALHARVGEDTTLQESLGLFSRLSVHGHELDGELKRLETEPDKAHVRNLLPDLRARTEQITTSADALRHAARDRASHFAGDDLDALSAQIDLEAGALRHWTAPDARPAAPEASDTAGKVQQPARPAITPPGVRPVYPWQKKPRPESTT